MLIYDWLPCTLTSIDTSLKVFLFFLLNNNIISSFHYQYHRPRKGSQVLNPCSPSLLTLLPPLQNMPRRFITTCSAPSYQLPKIFSASLQLIQSRHDSLHSNTGLLPSLSALSSFAKTPQDLTSCHTSTRLLSHVNYHQCPLSHVAPCGVSLPLCRYHRWVYHFGVVVPFWPAQYSCNDPHCLGEYRRHAFAYANIYLRHLHPVLPLHQECLSRGGEGVEVHVCVFSCYTCTHEWWCKPDNAC